MKKILFTLVSAGLVLGIMSCSSSPKEEDNTAQEKADAKEAQKVTQEIQKSNPTEYKPIIGAEGVPQPDWVYATPTSPEGIYASGAAKMSSKPISLKAAQANARDNMARTLETAVKNVVESYLQNSGIETDMQTSARYMEASVQKSTQVLRGLAQQGYWMDQDGTAYVLMFLPYSFAAPETTKIVEEVTQDVKKKNAVVITEEDFAKAVEKYGLNN